MGIHIDNFSTRQLKRLAPLQLSDKITATESRQYIYLEKDSLKNIHKKLIKIFYRDTLENMRAKFDIVSELEANRDAIEIPELVLPEGIITIDGMIKGIKLPLIEENINMTLLLNNPNVKNDGLSEDVEKEAEDEVQKLTDKKVKLVDEIVAAKEKEILTV